VSRKSSNRTPSKFAARQIAAHDFFISVRCPMAPDVAGNKKGDGVSWFTLISTNSCRTKPITDGERGQKIGVPP
jgi:hypothetical protein